jgi:hypothetical protein
MYDYCVWCYLELHVCTVLQCLERERICDWGGALRVLGFRLPDVMSCVFLCIHARYAEGTLEARKKICFPVFNITCYGPFVVKHGGDYWTGLECNRLSLHCESDVETLSLIDCCGLHCHFRNILQLLACCCVVLYCNCISVLWAAERRGFGTRVLTVRRHALSSKAVLKTVNIRYLLPNCSVSPAARHHCDDFRSHSACVCFTLQLQKLIPLNKLN